MDTVDTRKELFARFGTCGACCNILVATMLAGASDKPWLEQFAIYGSGQALFNHQTFHAEIAGALVYCIPIRGPCSLKTVPQWILLVHLVSMQSASYLYVGILAGGFCTNLDANVWAPRGQSNMKFSFLQWRSFPKPEPTRTIWGHQLGSCRLEPQASLRP